MGNESQDNGARPLLTPDEAAKLLGLDKRVKHPGRAIRKMVRRGELAAVRVTRYLMIDPDSVDRLRAGT